MHGTRKRAHAAANREPEVEADVVVVGGGGAGLAAAIEARSLGRSVILLEKGEKLGGSTAWSVGSVSATNTPHQLRKGIKDSPDDHFEDMGRFGSQYGLEDNLELRRILVDNVTDTFNWLMAKGIRFYGPILEPPHRKPRMHNVLPNSRAFIHHLGRHARRIGVEIVTGVRARDVVIEDGGARGVRADARSGPAVYRARGGVVLATGDFSGNPEMRVKYVSPQMRDVQVINALNTGDGHQMALALGGRIVHPQFQNAGLKFQAPPARWITRIPPYTALMGLVGDAMDRLPDWMLRPFVMSFLTTVLGPSYDLYAEGALLINRDGDRFVDERRIKGNELSITGQPGQHAFILLDRELTAKFSAWPYYLSTAPGIAYGYIPDYRRSRKDIFHTGRSLSEVARRIGAAPGRLEETISAHNAEVASTEPRRRPLGDGPYVALGPIRYFCNFTDSGVAVSSRLEVLGHGDQPVRRLYAAGFVGMGGTLLKGHGHHLGWAFTSGRIAGRNAALGALSENVGEDGHG